MTRTGNTNPRRVVVPTRTVRHATRWRITSKQNRSIWTSLTTVCSSTNQTVKRTIHTSTSDHSWTDSYAGSYISYTLGVFSISSSRTTWHAVTIISEVDTNWIRNTISSFLGISWRTASYTSKWILHHQETWLTKTTFHHKWTVKGTRLTSVEVTVDTGSILRRSIGTNWTSSMTTAIDQVQSSLAECATKTIICCVVTFLTVWRTSLAV